MLWLYLCWLPLMLAQVMRKSCLHGLWKRVRGSIKKMPRSTSSEWMGQRKRRGHEPQRGIRGRTGQVPGWRRKGRESAAAGGPSQKCRAEKEGHCSWSAVMSRDCLLPQTPGLAGLKEGSCNGGHRGYSPLLMSYTSMPLLNPTGTLWGMFAGKFQIWENDIRGWWC